MIAIAVWRTAWGYSMCIRSFYEHKPVTLELVNETLDRLSAIAEQCNLYPDTMHRIRQVNVPVGLARENYEQFCLLAQLENFHITIVDFDVVS
jgi:hypothetical protein